MGKVLIVLGMHRSGTSLFSSWLHSCNLQLGDRLLGNNFSNEKGHYEDLDFLYLHEETLIANQIHPSGLFPPFNFELNDYYFNKLKSNIIFKNLLHKQWGWKEPRTCLFLKYYPQFLPNAQYIILYRDYQFVVDSLIRRDIKSLNLWYANLSESDKEANIEHLRA